MKNKIKKPEILAPAGSFESAIYAFMAGADAVYFGLTSFSARKFAVNFNEDQYRKLLEYSRKNNKKVYLTINTLIFDDELQNLIRTLRFLKLFTPDAIIVQDIGIIDLIREYLYDIPIHLSTQAGTYSKFSYDLLSLLKVKRVVVARESTFSTIKKLKDHFKNIEIEVFIHGALCYSFSGYCLASGILTNRSGNRGECAQICRNYFNFEKFKNLNDVKLTPFSCNDLNLQTKILELSEIGIDSFKIEGRMKSPEYTFYTVKYYRNIIDKKLNPIESSEFLKDSKTSFSRMPTLAYFNESHAENLVNPFLPSHLGIIAGEILDINKDQIKIILKEKIAIKDGLLLIFKFNSNFFTFPFSVDFLKVNNKNEIKAEKGKKAIILSNSLNEFWDKIFKIKDFDDVQLKKLINVSNIDLFDPDYFDINKINNNNFIFIRKISNRDKDLKKINENLYEKIKYNITMEINAKVDEEENQLSSKSNYPFNLLFEYKFNILDKIFIKTILTKAFFKTGEKSYFNIFKNSFSNSSKEDNFKIFLKIDENSSILLDKIFIPPSLNKKFINEIKNNILDEFNKFVDPQSYLNSNPSEFLIGENLKEFDVIFDFDQQKIKDDILLRLKEDKVIIDNKFNRKNISPKTYIPNNEDDKIVPFTSFEHLVDSDLLQNELIYKKGNIAILPLHPIIENEKNYIEMLDKLILKNEKHIFLLGINSTWHFYLYKKYNKNNNVFFFFDFYIYISNRFSYSYYSRFNKSVFGFHYIENNSSLNINTKQNNLPLFNITGFNPPLFLSRGCLQKNIFNANKCLDNCPKKFLYKLYNQKNRFLYTIDECISYLFKVRD